MNLYDMLSPESPYVFYDSDHGFCINTEDVFNLIEQLQLKGLWEKSVKTSAETPILLLLMRGEQNDS